MYCEILRDFGPSYKSSAEVQRITHHGSKESLKKEGDLCAVVLHF